MNCFGYFDLLDPVSFINIVIQAIQISKSLDDIFRSLEFPYRFIYERKRKSGEWSSSPPFRSKYLWKLILKRVGELIHSEAFLPNISNINSSYMGFFELCSIDFLENGEITSIRTYPWKQYIIFPDFLFYPTEYIIIDENSKCFFIKNGTCTFSNRYFIWYTKEEFKILSDTPWNDDNLIFRDKIHKYINDETLCRFYIEVEETICGTIISFSNFISDEVGTKILYRFRNSKLEFFSRVYNKKLLLHGWGMQDLFSNNYEFYCYDNLLKPINLKFMILDIFSIGISETNIEFIHHGSDVPELSFVEIILNENRSIYGVIEYFERKLLWSCILPRSTNIITFDLFVLIGNDVYDLYTGRILFSSKTEEPPLYLLRKKNNTGYWVIKNMK